MKRLKLRQRCAWEVVFAALLLVLIDIFPPQLMVVLVLWGLIFLSVLFVDPRKKTLLAGSIVGVLLALNLVLPYFMQTTYYRPYERLRKIHSRGFRRYAPNQDVVVERSHGDLLAVGFRHPEVQELKQTRSLQFVTDRYGYRNTTVLPEYDLILIGDSFVAGNGNSQDDTISEALGKHGLRSYNLGHAGNIAEYIRSFQSADKEMEVSGRRIVFVFEGNDFRGRDYCVDEIAFFVRLRRYHRLLRELHISRFISAISSKFSIVAADTSPAITVKALPDGRKMGFFNEYLNAALETSFNGKCLENLLQRAEDAIAMLVFIPTKARTYSFLFEDPQSNLNGVSIYSRESSRIAAKLGIPYLDLTEPLRTRSMSLLPAGKLTFWRDDSHWNPEGIRAAADVIALALKKTSITSHEDRTAAPVDSRSNER